MLAVYAFLGLFAAVCHLTASALGAQVKAVNFGIVPLFQLGLWRIGLLPFSSSVELRGRGGDEGNWFQLGFARRLAILLLPWLVYAVPPLVLLGTGRTASSIAHGFEQLFATPNLTEVMRSFFALVRTAPAAILVGVVFTKGFVANAPIAAGNLITELRWKRAHLLNILLMLGMLFWVVGRLLWAVWHAV